MSVTLSTSSSNSVARHLVDNQRGIQRVSKTLSTGRQINKAGDDAAGLAISSQMRARVKSLEKCNQNIQDGISLVQTAEGGLRAIQDMVRRIRDLAVQAASDTLTTADRNMIQIEVDALVEEVDRISSAATFNGKKLIGPVPDTPDPADVVFVIDSSATMAGEIANVIAGLGALTAGLAAAGITARYALIDVNDTRTPADGTNLDANFTNAAGISAALTALTPVTGGTVRMWDSIANTLPGGSDAPSWAGTPPTVRYMIQVTDTSANEGGTFTSEAGQAANLVANNTKYYGVIALGFNAQYDGLATATGGSLFDISSADYNPLLTTIRNDIIATAQGFVLQGPWSIHSGANQNETITLDVPMDSSARGLGVDSLDVTTRSGAAAAIGTTDAALTELGGLVSQLGAQQNRLAAALGANEIETGNLNAAVSTIVDADLAASMMDLAKRQIIEQSGTAMLSQANANFRAVLQLLNR